MEKQSPLLRLWELGKDDHGGLVGAICSASIGVLCGMLPYFAAAQIIIGFLNGNKEISFTRWLCPCPTGPRSPSSKVSGSGSWKSSPGCRWAP